MNIKKINVNNLEYNIGVDWDNIDNKIVATTEKDGLMSTQDKLILNQFLSALLDNVTIELNEPYLFERGTVLNITISWIIKNNGETLVPDYLYLNDVQLLPTTNNRVFSNVSTDTKYTIKVIKNGLSTEAFTEAIFKDPIYYGSLDADTELTELVIDSLNKILSKNLELVNVTFNLENLLVCFAYPKSYGDLKMISDLNFNYINSFNKTELDINNILYIVYVLKDPATYSNLILYFS